MHANVMRNLAKEEETNAQENLTVNRCVDKKSLPISIKKKAGGNRFTTFISNSAQNYDEYYSNVHPSLGCSI